MSHRVWCLVWTSFLLSVPAFGAGKAQGLVAISDTAIFHDAESNSILRNARRGETFAGITTSGGERNMQGASGGWIAQEINGRLRIVFFVEGPPGKTGRGWVPKDSVVKFTYECGCGTEKTAFKERPDPCSPFARGPSVGKPQVWNPCYEEARDEKLVALGVPAVEAKRQALGDGDQAPNASATLCGKNFRSSGSMMRGTTFTTHEMVHVDRAGAVAHLTGVLEERNFEIVGSDSSTGEIRATRPVMRGRGYELTITMSAVLEQTRLDATLKLPMGIPSEDEVVRDDLCAILSSLPSSVQQSQAAAGKSTKKTKTLPTESATSVEERLKKLDELLSKKLITKEEYEVQRAKILSEL